MSQQQISGAFRSTQLTNPSVNLNLDSGLIVTVSEWQTGAALIDPVPIQPPLGERWSIVNAIIQFNGALAYVNSPGWFGRLGKLIGGLARSATPTQDPSGRQWVNSSLVSLPSDKSALSVLWDGAQDPAFPGFIFPSTPPVDSPVVGSISPPIPLEVTSGDQLFIGLWLTPSLVQNVAIWIYGATYTIVYDDGKQPTSTWGS